MPRKDYLGTMETMAEFAATDELAHMLRFVASLPTAQTAKAALLNAAHRIQHDNREFDHDRDMVKMDGREG